jgi:DNA-directed RNA polymerase specialized sigma24 family protein
MLESRESAAGSTRVAVLGELYREHYLRLVRLAVQLVDDQTSAEDVVQDVFARLHRSQQVPSDPGPPHITRSGLPDLAAQRPR